ncbi:hypothetical protein U4L45_22495, partial [Klebsiella pneumoniae]|nr:hypothetical protein [Klebsiella pneumoniae]
IFFPSNKPSHRSCSLFTNQYSLLEKTDDNGKIILINGKPVMVDDPDGYNPVILKRLPEVTIFD